MCVLSINCPTGSYANSTNNQCSGCSSPCQTCSSSVSCLTCNVNYVLSGNICILSCLTGYLNITNVCLICISPCATCSISLNNCTSCLQNLSPSMYLNGNTCIISTYCPSNTYANNTLNSC